MYKMEVSHMKGRMNSEYGEIVINTDVIAGL